VYQALLTRRYLFSRVMPLLSALAVMLCTAMVLVVWSVMGGFLNLLLLSGKSMIGDVSINWPVAGIARYETLIERLEADPMVEAATPTIETLGLLSLPIGDTKTVQVIGIEPDGYNAVTGYFDRLWWKPLETPLPRDKDRTDIRLKYTATMKQAEAAGRAMEERDPETGLLRPAITLGLEVSRPNNRRTPEGPIIPVYDFMPNTDVTLQVMPLSRRGVPIRPEARTFAVANEFRTGLYEADANWVLVPLAELQRMLMLDQAERTTEDESALPIVERDADGRERFVRPKKTVIEPARATTLFVKAAPGVTADALEKRAAEIYRDFYAEFSPTTRLPDPTRIAIYTWENKPGLSTFIAAVKKETALVLVLFGFISMTAVFLVFAIFWSMISEKTKDIGVLRAIGASRIGIAWLFLRYGLAIGIVGSLGGGALAFLVVHNINPIHDWMGQALGISVWDPKIYYFIEIPNKVEPSKATIVLAFGILSSALGALIPAARAAFMDPVRALRFE
jgi:lipoprotein-releasing system permease protein